MMHKELEDLLLNNTEQQDEQKTTPVSENRIIAVKSPLSRISNLTQIVHDDNALSKEYSKESESVLTWKSLDPLKRRLVYDVFPKVHKIVYY